MADKSLTCKVCGREFTPWSENQKIIKTADGRHFDTFDCPKCGCQIVAQERIVEGQSLVSNDDIFQTNMNELFKTCFEFENRFDVDNFNSNISYLLRNYGHLSVADAKYIVGNDETVRYADTKYGWHSFRGVRVSKNRNGKYFVYMPAVRKLNLEE